MIYVAGGQGVSSAKTHCGGQRAALSVRLCFPPCLRQGLLVSPHFLQPGSVGPQLTAKRMAPGLGGAGLPSLLTWKTETKGLQPPG